ncbi:MAG: ATP-binding protein [Tissierellia bacterium]|nr:ATP-binding protein [Tissierellia bacterium]
MYSFCASVKSNVNYLQVFNKKLMDMISEVITDENLLFEIRLILNELIGNGVIHGNCCDETKIVSVSVHISDTCFRVCVKDQGDGITCAGPIVRRSSDLMGGRGLALVRSCVDEMEACYNRITCVKYL